MGAATKIQQTAEDMDAATLHPGDRFRCVTFGTRFSGADCAARHVRVATKNDLPASVQCGTCPAGEARARALGKTTPPVAAPKRRGGMFLAPREPMTARTCAAADGTPRGALTAQAAAERVVAVAAREPVVAPVREVAEPAPTPRAPRPPKDCPRHAKPRASVGHGPLAAWCQVCIDSARRSLRTDGVEVSDEAAREWLRSPLSARSGPRIGRVIDWSAQPLGKVPDPQIAAALGVNVSSVRRQRERRGIAACPEVHTYKGSGVDWDAQPLGKVSDAIIAAEVGVTPEAVRAQRKKRGIDPAPFATPASATCTREACDGAVVPSPHAPTIDGVCSTCRNEVRTKLRRQLGRTPTAEERVEWLATHPKGGTPTGRPPRDPGPAPVAETRAPRDDAQVSEAEAWAQAFAARCAVEAERAARETAAAGRLFDQLDAAWRECSELRQDLRAALNAGAKWRHIAETLAKLLTETMGVAAEVVREVGRG